MQITTAPRQFATAASFVDVPTFVTSMNIAAGDTDYAARYAGSGNATSAYLMAKHAWGTASTAVRFAPDAVTDLVSTGIALLQSACDTLAGAQSLSLDQQYAACSNALGPLQVAAMQLRTAASQAVAGAAS